MIRTFGTLTSKLVGSCIFEEDPQPMLYFYVVGLMIMQYFVVAALNVYFDPSLLRIFESTCMLGFIVPVNARWNQLYPIAVQ